MNFFRAIALLVPLFLAAANTGAWACSACFDPAGSDKMNHAAAVGISAMVVLMFVMLGALFAIGRHFAWRARNPLPDYDELLSEDDSDKTEPDNKS